VQYLALIIESPSVMKQLVYILFHIFARTLLVKVLGVVVTALMVVIVVACVSLRGC